MGGWWRVRGLYDQSMPVVLLVFGMLLRKFPPGKWAKGMGILYICDDDWRFTTNTQGGGLKSAGCHIKKDMSDVPYIYHTSKCN